MPLVLKSWLSAGLRSRQGRFRPSLPCALLLFALPLSASAVSVLGQVSPGPLFLPACGPVSCLFNSYRYLEGPSPPLVGRIYVQSLLSGWPFPFIVPPGTVTTGPSTAVGSGARIKRNGQITVLVLNNGQGAEVADALGCKGMALPGECQIGALDAAGSLRSLDSMAVFGTLGNASLIVD